MTSIVYRPTATGNLFGDPSRTFESATNSFNNATSALTGAFDKYRQGVVGAKDKRTEDAILALKGLTDMDQYNQVTSQLNTPEAIAQRYGNVDVNKVTEALRSQEGTIKNKFLTDDAYKQKVINVNDRDALNRVKADYSNLSLEEIQKLNLTDQATKYGIENLSKLAAAREAAETEAQNDIRFTTQQDRDLLSQDASRLSMSSIKQQMGFDADNHTTRKTRENEKYERQKDAYQDGVLLNQKLGDLLNQRETSVNEALKLRKNFADQFPEGQVFLDGSGNIRVNENLTPAIQKGILDQYEKNVKPQEPQFNTDKDQMSTLAKSAVSLNANPQQTASFINNLKEMQNITNSLNPQDELQLQQAVTNLTNENQNELATITTEFDRVVRNNPIDVVVTPEQEKIKIGPVKQELFDRFPSTAWWSGVGGDNFKEEFNEKLRENNYPAWLVQDAIRSVGTSKNTFGNDGFPFDLFKETLDELMQRYQKSLKNIEIVDRAQDTKKQKEVALAKKLFTNTQELTKAAKAQSRVFDVNSTKSPLFK